MAHHIGEIGALLRTRCRGAQFIENNLIQALVEPCSFPAKRPVNILRNAADGVLLFWCLLLHACMIARSAGSKPGTLRDDIGSVQPCLSGIRPDRLR